MIERQISCGKVWARTAGDRWIAL